MTTKYFRYGYRPNFSIYRMTKILKSNHSYQLCFQTSLRLPSLEEYIDFNNNLGNDKNKYNQAPT